MKDAAKLIVEDNRTNSRSTLAVKGRKGLAAPAAKPFLIGEPARTRTWDQLITHHFGFRRPIGFVVRTIPSPYPLEDVGGRRLVSTPSRARPGLARDRHQRGLEGFPEFDACSPAGFPTGLPFESQLLYHLSYGPAVAREGRPLNTPRVSPDQFLAALPFGTIFHGGRENFSR